MTRVPTQRLADWPPEPGRAVDVIAVGRSGDAICGRILAGSGRILVRAGLFAIRPVEGELFTLDVARRTRQDRFWLLEGSIRSPRLEPRALRLEPLALLPRTVIEPRNDDKLSNGELEYELQTVIPKVPGYPSSGRAAIEEISAFWDAGDTELAELLAGELLARDLRCLEAHALLGGFFLDGPVEARWTERALRHYRVGVTIGELSLAGSFEGSLPWRWPGNRPFLRCLFGYARCLERLGDTDAAQNTLERLQELAPDDPLDVSPPPSEG